MIKERLVILGITVVVLGVLIYDMMSKESPKGGDGVTEDENYLLPQADSAHLYKEADADLVFLGEIRGNDPAGLEFGALEELLQKADFVSGGLGNAPSVDDEKAIGGFLGKLKKKGFTSLSLANHRLGATLSSEELASLASKLQGEKIDWFGPSATSDGPGAVVKTELACGEKKVAVYQIGVSERGVPVKKRDDSPSESGEESGEEQADKADSAEEGQLDDGPVDELFVGKIDIVAVGKQVEELKEKDPEAIVVVHPNWGREKNWKTNFQVRAARAWVDAGADYVMGHGTGMMQQVERHEDGWILHGLGDAVVEGGGDGETFSLTARLTLREEGGEIKRRLKIYPVLFQKGKDAAAEVATGVDAREMGKVYWDLIIKQWKKNDRWLKRQLWVGKDEFGRFVQLGFEEDEEVAK